MTHTEFWLTYQLASRAHLENSATTQLVELEFQNHKMVDLEDVLDYVFRQGFVEAKHRSATWWETKEGVKVRAAASVEEVLREGVGRCPETSLRLVVQDIPAALWFTYVYKHNPSAPVVTQRIKLPVLAASPVGSTPTTPTSGCPMPMPVPHPHPQPVKMDRLAHVTNYIFSQGFLEPKHRAVVHWEGLCGNKIEEFTTVEEAINGWGIGHCEDKPLRLIIDAAHPTCPVISKPTCPAIREEVVSVIRTHSPIYEHHHHLPIEAKYTIFKNVHGGYHF